MASQPNASNDRKQEDDEAGELVSGVSDEVVVVPSLQEMPVASTEFAYVRLLTHVLGATSPVLCMETRPGDGLSDSARRLLDNGLSVTFMDRPIPSRSTELPHSRVARRPSELMEWAQKQRPRVIHVIGDPHVAYFLLQSRKVGLLDFDCRINLHVITTFGYRLLIGREQIGDPADLARIQMETAAIGMADCVVAQSQTIADWMLEHHGAVKSRLTVVPEVFVSAPDKAHHARSGDGSSVMFAGTLTETKGLTTFVYAMRHLQLEHGLTPDVEFTGHMPDGFPADDFIESILGEAGFNIEFLPAGDHGHFLKRMAGAGVVVVASRLDERPMVVQECKAYGVPVIVTGVGDTSQEGAGDQGAVRIVANRYQDVADAVRQSLAGHQQVLREEDRAACNKAARAQWDKMLTGLRGPAKRQTSSRRKAGGAEPLVSVCVAHFNRPELLTLVLESLEQQTYRNFEIVVVDDGSTKDNARAAEALVGKYENSTFIRTANRYLGAARNAGARQAKGEYLLFKDDDNYSKANEIETFVKCAQYSKADILTCFSDNFESAGRPEPETLIGTRRLPFGPGLGINLFRNSFGDSNCFVRRDVWQKVGGFSEHYRIGLDDHEFFLRATLQGYQLDVVPEALYFYRLGGKKMKRFHVSKQANEQRIMSTVLKHSGMSLLDVATIYLARKHAEQ